MTTFYLDGTTGSDSNDGLSSGAPKLTVNGCAGANGTFAAETTLYVAAGSAPVIGDTRATSSTGQDFRTPAGANLTIRAYGGGSRPQITMLGRGFKTQTTGNLDIQDVNILQDPTAQPSTLGNGLTSRTGGGMRVVNCDITGFFNAIQCGTGTVMIDTVRVYSPGNNGFYVDIAADATLGSGGIIRSCEGYARNPTGNDMLTLHNGGIGVANDWLIEDCLMSATDGAAMESGCDIGEQYIGATIRRNRFIGPVQWGFVQGSLVRGGLNRNFTTRSLMLAAYTRENIGINDDGGNPNFVGSITGGTVAFVTADGANNGIYQLTGNDPAELASWTGPMTADDLIATPSIYYQNQVIGSVGGLQLQHPGTQFVANTLTDVTLGDWLITTSGSYGGGSMIGATAMAYGCKLLDNVFATSSGKYRSVQTGNLTTSTRDMVSITALRSQITQRTRLTLKGNVIRQRAEHMGNFVSFAATADHGYLDSDYNAWIADSGVGDATWPAFSDSAGTSRTFTAYKAINGGSDAHSLWQTPETALIDSDCRPLDSSTLIGAGVARSGIDVGIPSQDVEQTPVSIPPDIGAYAYVSEAAQSAVRATPRRMLRAVRTAGTPPTGGAAPGAVTGLANTSATASTLSMSWTAESASTYYELRYSLAGAGAWTTYADTFTTTSGTISGLTASTSYDVQVRGGNGAGTGDWSASVTAATV